MSRCQVELGRIPCLYQASRVRTRSDALFMNVGLIEQRYLQQSWLHTSRCGFRRPLCLRTTLGISTTRAQSLRACLWNATESDLSHPVPRLRALGLSCELRLQGTSSDVAASVRAAAACPPGTCAPTPAH